MRRLTEILAHLFFPEDADPGEEGNPDSPPDPLDDYSHVSIPEEEFRFSLRANALDFLVEFLPLLFVIFVAIRQVISSPTLLTESLLLVIIPLAACYLVIVWIDTGRWGVVHPVLAQLPQAYRRFREESGVFQIVLGLDLILGVTTVFFVLSGSVFLKDGIDFLLLLVGIGLFLNISIIVVYAIEATYGELF